ncbi:MAG: protein-glutamate O-methyltransferase CheR [Alphaproteobacteria bacterium]|nr:protein-glutamate O-methyltransferase CheR [Alphaproteobacteria bacterium]
MTPADLAFIAQMLKRRSGLIVTADKTYLLESRLGPVARKHGLTNLDAIVAKLRAGDEPLARSVTEAMTTNESFFFRDRTPFDHFEKIMLPALTKVRLSQRKLRIWCAAASTGQEPYSLAMLLKERSKQINDWKIEILGTDLSPDVLSRAQAGIYSQFEVQRGLPIQMLVKNFAKESEQWRIKEEIRSMVCYRVFNLLDPFTGLGTYDIVFCRNVLIYFDEQTKKSVLERIAQLLPDDGYLVLGAAETVVGVTNAFAPVDGARGLYAKNVSAVETRKFAS